MSDLRRYQQLFKALSQSIPSERLIFSRLRTFAYATDASFYRIVPKLVVQVQSEAEVIATIRACSSLDIPYTFRAAGTSLSGQALSDSVLVQISRLWDEIRISAAGETVRCSPAAIGGRVNCALASFQRKIGPDPASIDSAMIAGIAANNASGMCCGNVQDTYHTMASIRVVFSDGTVLDTASDDSKKAFLVEKRDFVRKIYDLVELVKSNAALTERIRHKYRIKNTTGYSLNALIDCDDPFDVISRLMVGSEGTLGFISEITYRTVPDPPCHSTALVLFPDIRTACSAAADLARTRVFAVELMDRYSLRSIETKPEIPESFHTLAEDVTALLIESAAQSEQELQTTVNQVKNVLANHALVSPAFFTSDKGTSKRLWTIRKGLFPSLGQTRAAGTTIIIEDVAFVPERLADAALDLRSLFQEYGYGDAIIFGHALQGNLHFVFCVDFNRESEILRYSKFMDAMTQMVTEKYDGSLKAEHGTGRNISPFVEREWGAEAVQIMREIKTIFDPRGLLNPGVIFSDNPRNHVANLKRTPISHPAIEKCTECGFCERTCPSRHLSLTPRQRISAWREISRLSTSGDDLRGLREMKKEFQYEGTDTCAGDGLCATLCPVGIDTGAFIKELRAAEHSRIAHVLTGLAADHFSTCLHAARIMLTTGHLVQRCIGTEHLKLTTRWLRKAVGRAIPQWNAWVPKPASRFQDQESEIAGEPVVYFPSCVTRIFGVSGKDAHGEEQNVAIKQLLSKGGYHAVYPARLESLCCGMAFASKGFSDIAKQKMTELISALQETARGGRCIVVDTSPCAKRLQAYAAAAAGLQIYDISKFLLDRIVPRVQLRRKRGAIALHVPCSLRTNGEDSSLLELARLCAEKVYISSSSPCCGFAGDRGFTHPELTASALVRLEKEIPRNCSSGYSSSRTCELGVSLHSGISFQSIAYLLREVTAMN